MKKIKTLLNLNTIAGLFFTIAAILQIIEGDKIEAIIMLLCLILCRINVVENTFKEELNNKGNK